MSHCQETEVCVSPWPTVDINNRILIYITSFDIFNTCGCKKLLCVFNLHHNNLLYVLLHHHYILIPHESAVEILWYTLKCAIVNCNIEYKRHLMSVDMIVYWTHHNVLFWMETLVYCVWSRDASESRRPLCLCWTTEKLCVWENKSVSEGLKNHFCHLFNISLHVSHTDQWHEIKKQQKNSFSDVSLKEIIQVSERKVRTPKVIP